MGYCILCDQLCENFYHSSYHTVGNSWLEYNLNKKPIIKETVFIYTGTNFDKRHNENHYDSLYVENLSVFKGLKTWEEAKDLFYKLKVFE